MPALECLTCSNVLFFCQLSSPRPPVSRPSLIPYLCQLLPGPCQQQLLILQAGRDALAKAPTGSGKTLAYLAAIIHDLQSQEPHLSRAEGTYAIIMAPTRELCIQICDVLTLILRRFIWLVRSSSTAADTDLAITPNCQLVLQWWAAII